MLTREQIQDRLKTANLRKTAEGRRWVSKTSRKRFAHESEKEALEAFKKRKLAHVRHAQANLSRAEEELRLVEAKLFIDFRG